MSLSVKRLGVVRLVGDEPPTRFAQSSLAVGVAEWSWIVIR
jgi:hypothetical protein